MLRAWPQLGSSPLPDPVSATGALLPRKIAYGPVGYMNFGSVGPIERSSAWKQQYQRDRTAVIALPASNECQA